MGHLPESPLLRRPGAVAGSGTDAAVAAHYGSYYAEQRALVAGEGFVDLSHRGVVRIAGPDRLTLLHAVTTQFFEGLAPGRAVSAMVLSPQGHIEHLLFGVDDGEAFTAHVEPGLAPALVDFLTRMRFMMRVEAADVTDELAVAWRPGPGFVVVPRPDLATLADGWGPPGGTWAYDALRIARGEPRFGVDTDHRTIPNELGLLGTAVHLEKGCYPGQETVARVHTLGRPPRRLALLHLDGSADRLPAEGSPLLADGREVGFVGSSARHYELGPIALGLVKRGVAVDAALVVDGIGAAQEVLVDPEVGLHVRPLR